MRENYNPNAQITIKSHAGFRLRHKWIEKIFVDSRKIFGYLFILNFILIFLLLISDGIGNNEYYMTIKELKAFCESSGICNGKLCCEGKEVSVKGYLDFINIFHPKTYPNVLYPKFRIFDGPDITKTKNPWSIYTHSLEIYPVEGNIQRLFERLIEKRGFPLKLVYIKGSIRGFDAHMEKGTQRLINLVIKAEDAFFEGE